MNARYYLLFLLLWGYTLQAQDFSQYKEGFLRLTPNDSIPGFIERTGEKQLAKTVSFLPVLDERMEVQVYQPGEIHGFGFVGGNEYQSLVGNFVNPNLPSVAVFTFARLRIDGRLQLLEVVEEDAKYPIFALRKGNQLQMLRSPEAQPNRSRVEQMEAWNRNRLQVLLGDCDKVKNSLFRLRVERERLIELARSYNQCQQKKEKLSWEEEEKASISFLPGVEGGFLTPRIDRTDFFAVGAGFFVEKLDPLMQQRLSWSIGAQAWAGRAENDAGISGNIYMLRIPVKLNLALTMGEIKTIWQGGAMTAFYRDMRSVGWEFEPQLFMGLGVQLGQLRILGLAEKGFNALPNDFGFQLNVSYLLTKR
ncbi:MAG: hypothetical protein AAFR61_19955 [Bacteroidota bacterium]